MKNSKGASAIILIIIAVLILAVIGGTIWYIISKKPQQAERDRYKNWETYQNKEYGFEIKYPNQFEIVDRASWEKPGEESFLDLYRQANQEQKLMGWIHVAVKMENIPEFEWRGLLGSDVDILIREEGIDKIAEEMEKSLEGIYDVKVLQGNTQNYSAIIVEQEVVLEQLKDKWPQVTSYLIEGKNYSYVLSYNGNPDQNRSRDVSRQIIDSFKLSD